MKDSGRPAASPKLAPITVRVPAAINYLGISRSKLYELISAGEIETIKVGGCTLVPVASLAEFIERMRSAQQQSTPKRSSELPGEPRDGKRSRRGAPAAD